MAAVGIRVSQWIAYHGLALNVTTDLAPFHWIVPCGIQNRGVGSIKELVGQPQSLTKCKIPDLHNPDDCQLIEITYRSLIKEFSEVFQVEVQQETSSLTSLS